MTDHFDRAVARTHRHARQLLRTGVPPVVAADAMLTEALALWGADTGRHEAAKALTVLWVAARDAKHAE